MTRIHGNRLSICVAALICAVCALCLLPNAAFADDRSGSTSMSKPTLQQLRDRYFAITPASDTRYATEPSLTAPYEPAGSLPTATLKNGEDTINFMRYAAGLPDITLDSTLNVNAQLGALTQAATGSFGHTPPRPSGMDDTRYQDGFYSCCTSNISWSMGFDNDEIISLAVTGQMTETNSSSSGLTQNVDSVGHRRWLLDPKTKTMGIGSVSGANNATYTNVRVFNDSVVHSPAVGSVDMSGNPDYSFIAWPASGNALNDFFPIWSPWSVSLDPNDFNNPDPSQITVKLESPTGIVYTLNNADPANSVAGEYFNVNNAGYGSGPCIMFSPGFNTLKDASITEYEGTWKVNITGLKTKSDADTSLSYTTTFDSAHIDIGDSASGCTVTLPDATYSFTGSKHEPVPTVKIGTTTLTKNVDYTVSYASNISPGTAKVTVTGAGIYDGSITKTFIIDKADIDDVTVAGLIDRTYDGKAQTIAKTALTVKLGSYNLLSTDYSISFSDNIDAGQATMTLTGTGTRFTGTKTVPFTINKMSLATPNTFSIGTINSITYTGEAIEPTPYIKWNGKTLVKGTDYTLSYSDNVNAGSLTAKVTFTGTGNYTGSLDQPFTITKATLPNGCIAAIPDQTLVNGYAKPSPVVTVGGKNLTEGVDYTVSYSSVVAVGTGTVTVTGKGNYSGNQSQNFKIVPTGISSATVTAVPDQTYTGSALTPPLEVKLGEFTLTLDKDYTVSYSDNTDVGTARATVTGTGNYTGTTGADFEIKQASIAAAGIAAISDCAYMGSPFQPTPAVTLGGKTLVAGTDFDYEYADNTDAGTATVTVKGKGNYTASAEATFTITPKDLDDDMLEAISDQEYTGAAIEPAVTLRDGSTVLTLGTDYTVAYTDNTDRGTATVTISGIGNYAGTLNSSFAIINKSLSVATAQTTVPDQTYDNASLCPAVPVIVYKGTTLQENVDFRVGYENNVEAGTGTIVLTGMGDYGGALRIPFTIKPCSVDDVSFDVDPGDFVYGGSPVKPAVPAGSLTYTGDGTERVLVEGTDYTVGYADNTAPGTGKIIITGIKNFTGTYVIPFDITAGTTETVVNVAGDQRYATAAKEAKYAYPSGAAGVVVASGVNFPDALAGTGLAGALDYPILLTESSNLPADTARALSDLGITRGSKIIVLGGDSAVGGGVYDSLSAVVGAGNITRLAGASRFDTADAIFRYGADNALWTQSTALIASGNNFPDALSISAVAAAQGLPILLCDGGELPDSAKRDIVRYAPTAILAAGGSSVVSDATLSWAQVIGVTPERLAGGSRYSTSLAIAEYCTSNGLLSWDKVAYASGANFPDALAGSVVQGRDGSVLLLADSDTVDVLRAHKSDIATIKFFGGDSAVSRDLRTRAQTRLGWTSPAQINV